MAASDKQDEPWTHVCKTGIEVTTTMDKCPQCGIPRGFFQTNYELNLLAMKRYADILTQRLEPPMPKVQKEVLDLRDQFAIAALTGILAKPSTGGLPEEIATQCYAMADAMMEARDNG